MSPNVRRQRIVKKLAKRVREFRDEMSLREAATDIGISHATLSRVERGHLPDLLTFAAIMEWMQEPPDLYLGR